MKNRLHTLLYLSALMTGVSCSTERRLANMQQDNHAGIRLPFKDENKTVKDTITLPSYITYTDENGKEQTVTSAELDTVSGEYITSLQISEVTVTAKSKTIPERNGRINIEFIVTVPSALLRSEWRFVLIPIMGDQGSMTKMDSIIITGKEYGRLDERKSRNDERTLKGKSREMHLLSKRKGNYRERKILERKARMADSCFSKLVEGKGLKKKGLRLDTVIQRGDSLAYCYQQEIPTDDIARRLRLWFHAYINDTAQERFVMQNTDTLDYFISSMMQFLDRTERYVRKTINRRVTESMTAYVSFKQGSSEIIDTLGANREELDKIYKKMTELNRSNEFVFDSIKITAFSSPEGSYLTNQDLSRKRAVALKEYLVPVIRTNAEAVELMIAEGRGEDWTQLYEYMYRCPEIMNAAEITAVLKKEMNEDKRERLLQEKFPSAYEHITHEIYPKLRRVNFTFHLARRNMVEDIMFTDEIDTTYAAALELMDRRKYVEAMPKLLEYRDWNTAICYMSMGYNETAWQIFEEQPETANREYLKAILAARMGRNEEAVRLYMKSCALDPSLIMRGTLDPEISILIKRFRLNEDEW